MIISHRGLVGTVLGPISQNPMGISERQVSLISEEENGGLPHEMIGILMDYLAGQHWNSMVGRRSCTKRDSR